MSVQADTISSLRDRLAAARWAIGKNVLVNAVIFGPVTFEDTASRDAASSLLDSCEAAIDQLEGPLEARLAADPSYWPRWQEQAKVIADGIAQAIGSTQEWGYWSVLSSATVATAHDVGQAAQAVADALPTVGLGLGLLVGLVAVAVIVWKVA